MPHRATQILQARKPARPPRGECTSTYRKVLSLAEIKFLLVSRCFHRSWALLQFRVGD
jgi:hypothetical protein